MRKISLMVGWGQSLRLDGRKVWRIKKVGVSQLKRNKTTVCGLPSNHLPLTREARMWCGAQFFCIMRRIYDRLRRYNNRSCQKVEIAKRMSYDIIIKL